MPFITPHLERLIFENKAEYKTFNCALGQYFSLQLPSKQTVIVVGIEWNPFICPMDANDTWRNYLKNNEYQLRITDYNKQFFLNYRNNLLVTPFQNPAAVITDSSKVTDIKKFCSILPGDKVLTPCYFVLDGEQIVFVVSRNLISDATLGVGAGLLATSQEPNPPAGIKTFPQTILSAGAAPTLDYIPPTMLNAPAAPMATGSYTQEYYNGYSANSMLDTNQVDAVNYYFQLPLFTAHYVLLKENLTGHIY